MGQKLVIPGISEEKGFETIDKEDWVPLLIEGDTVLLSNINDEKQKIWVMTDEWMPEKLTKEKVKEKEKEEIKEVVSETLTIKQTEPVVQGGVPEESTKVEWAGYKITFESLKELRFDELLFYAMLEYSEEEIRDKLYCLFGHCQSGCKSCVKGE
jgi:hypothetical protein